MSNSRPKKGPHHDRSHRSHKADNAKQTEEPRSRYLSINSILTFLCLGIACCIGYKGYLETRVNTPFDSPKVVVKSGLAIPGRYWGTYRPGNYFGLKTREPFSPVMGLMWYFPRKMSANSNNIRHWCEQDDHLNYYTWTKHDGKTFGVQQINDGDFQITTSFVKRPGGTQGGDWTTRISVKSVDESTETGSSVSLIFYTAIESQTNGKINPSFAGAITGVVGETQELGPFVVRYYNVTGNIVTKSYLSVESGGLHLLKETVRSTLRQITDKESRRKHLVLPGDITHLQGEAGERVAPNFIATQLEVNVPFELDVVFESASFIDRPNTLTGGIFQTALKNKLHEFDTKFEDTFKLKSKNFSDNHIAFAKAVFSNLIGGIGYFYGASRVRSDHTKTPVPYWKAPLFTAVPSRSFFPRGFLWDEGFHGLLLAAWDLDLELDIIGHWFDLMNIEGWIPREQILGLEALAKVPEEFVTQTNTNANPPTFFLTLRFIIQNYAERLTEEDRLGTLERLYPRLVAWFDWFNTTQNGPLSGSYRWRGRDGKTTKELNPKTLTSGLDDYPRASHPTDDERHLDLRCWIMLGASTLAEIAKLLNREGQKYMDTYSYLSDVKLLDTLHWSEEYGRYADYGLHTDDVTLKKPPPLPSPSKPVQQELTRVTLTAPRLRLVDTTFGYVSLFPFFVHTFPSNSHRLQKMLTDIRNPQYLWTDYGLRSLSKKSPLYNKYNTEHDPPYWRGDIWINLNYLTLEALNYYSKLDGPYRQQAEDLYKELRHNLITNIFKQYVKTGYIWEHYNPKTGAGHGSHPFTGWSSLVVLIMAEMY
ncbi:mannosyl-oligosaccharide glucosidase GCS1 [Cimex lectularius]|uniref:Mannosyl-oligosaccharide glucosidase n=1 Tax=Cimex lectularius TaxID=79782 RepID=A0A8I6S960_CIMLE|nr:mannosyl-oligosaccharide glucosidase GCS1 [Cimex lectularius]